MLNVSETIYAQFANSPRIRTIISSMDQSLDPRSLIETFFFNVVDLETATGWGLDVWGRIVGVSRIIEVASGRWFGFDGASDATNIITPFDEAPFFNVSSSDGLTSNYVLSDDAFRKLILAKAAANITNGSITALNSILMTLFGSDTRHIWVEEDTSTRTLTIIFDFDISLVDATILETSGVLPRPTGVSIQYRRKTS